MEKIVQNSEKIFQKTTALKIAGGACVAHRNEASYTKYYRNNEKCHTIAIILLHYVHNIAENTNSELYLC